MPDIVNSFDPFYNILFIRISSIYLNEFYPDINVVPGKIILRNVNHLIKFKIKMKINVIIVKTISFIKDVSIKHTISLPFTLVFNDEALKLTYQMVEICCTSSCFFFIIITFVGGRYICSDLTHYTTI